MACPDAGRSESARATAAQGGLWAGVHEIQLHPQPGMIMEDAAPLATGELTPLYVKAVVLDNGREALGIVTLDQIGMDAEDVERAAALARERTGLPAEHILIACSHAHATPMLRRSVHPGKRMFNPHFGERTIALAEEWLNTVTEAVAEALQKARSGLQPASVGCVSCRLPWLSFNRRRLTRSFGAWTHWMGIPPDQALGVEGPIDPELGLLVLRDGKHRPLALLWNYSGHNSFHFGDRYSADLAYTVQQELDRRLGLHLPCLYLPGCGGNTNYYDYQPPHSEFGLRKATEELASAIIATHREACTLTKPELAARKATLQFARRDASRYWWEADVACKLPRWLEFGARETERMRTMGEHVRVAPVTVLRLGSTALVGLPGEIFVEFALAVKRRSPFARTLVVGYANGFLGYVATRRAFINGSYEVWPFMNSRVGREGGYLMVDKAVELLEELA